MKRITTVCTLLLGLLAFQPLTVNAQSADTTWIIEFNYMKSHNADYVTLESDVWKKVHQKRIEQGSLWSWDLWAVNFGVDESYDYVTVNVWRTWDSYENTWGESFERALEATQLDTPWEEIGSQTTAARTIVKNELWSFVDGTGDFSDSKYVQVNYMNAPALGAYRQMESDVFKPIFERFIENGDVEAWVVLSKLRPGGSDYPYNHVVFHWFSSLEQMYGEQEETMTEIMAKVHPSIPSSDLFDMADERRDYARGELWQKIDSAN